MTTYVYDYGDETVKIYPVKVKVAKAVMTLLETVTGYYVEIVYKTESEG